MVNACSEIIDGKQALAAAGRLRDLLCREARTMRTHGVRYRSTQRAVEIIDELEEQLTGKRGRLWRYRRNSLKLGTKG